MLLLLTMLRTMLRMRIRILSVVSPPLTPLALLVLLVRRKVMLTLTLILLCLR